MDISRSRVAVVSASREVVIFQGGSWIHIAQYELLKELFSCFGSTVHSNGGGGGGVGAAYGIGAFRNGRPFDRNPTTWVPQAPLRNGSYDQYIESQEAELGCSIHRFKMVDRLFLSHLSHLNLRIPHFECKLGDSCLKKKWQKIGIYIV